MKGLDSFIACSRQWPERAALIAGQQRTTWNALAERTRRLAIGLLRHGIQPGTRIAILIPPGVDCLALAYASLTVGAVPVFLDPGLGLRRLLHLLDTSGATVFAGTPLAQCARIWQSSLRPTLTLSTAWWPSCITLNQLAAEDGPWPSCTIPSSAPGLVLYTSGATGGHKAITASRATLDAQVSALRALAAIDDESILLAVLPTMILLGPALGCTIRISNHLTGSRLADDLKASTHTFGSPAVWEPLADHLERTGDTMQHLRSLLMGGCPIPPDLLRRWRQLAPQAQILSVYGATEGVPLASATVEDITNHTNGPGTLIGHPTPGVTLTCIPLPNHPSIGRILAQGSVVAGNGSADLGDLGFCDDHGRWWFLGRADERVECHGQLWTTAAVEAGFAHPAIRRVALIGLGERPQQTPVLVLEPHHFPCLSADKIRLAQTVLVANPSLTAALGLTTSRVLVRRRMPVDARHRAKILRGLLVPWAAQHVSAEHP